MGRQPRTRAGLCGDRLGYARGGIVSSLHPSKPTEAAPYEELAQVYEKQGFLEKALANYRQALAREPSPDIYLHMADCYVHLHDITHAVELLAQAKTRLPNADYDVRLGDIYQGLGDMAHAGSAWEEALSADPKRDDVRLKLTLIYDQLHRRQDTDRLFKQLIAAYPQSRARCIISGRWCFGNAAKKRRPARKRFSWNGFHRRNLWLITTSSCSRRYGNPYDQKNIGPAPGALLPRASSLYGRRLPGTLDDGNGNAGVRLQPRAPLGEFPPFRRRV